MTASNILNIRYSWWSLIGAFGVLMLITVLTASAQFRTEVISDGLLVSAADLQSIGWEVTGNSAHATFGKSGIALSLSEPGLIRVRLRRPYQLSKIARQEVEYLRISGQLERLSDPVFLRHKNLRPTFYVKVLTGQKIDYFGSVVRTYGLGSQKQFSRLIRPGADTDTIEVNWQLRTEGTWMLKKLRIEAVVTASRYTWARAVLLMMAIVLGVSFLLLIGSRLSRWQWLALGASVFLAVGFSGISKVAMRATAQFLIQGWQQWAPVSWTPSEFELHKLGHLLIFLFLAVVFMVFRQRLKISFFQVTSLLFVLACFTEAMQGHQLGRSSSAFDIVVDMSGMLIGLILWCLADRVGKGSNSG